MATLMRWAAERLDALAEHGEVRMSAEAWHHWWLVDGVWVVERGPHSIEVHIVPESQLRNHLPTGCVCGAKVDVMADGVLRVTHRLRPDHPVGR
jgi:hypothetical protein